MNFPYEIVFAMIGVYFVVFWIACIVYVSNDSKRYSQSEIVRFFYIFMTAFFGLFGVFLYLFFRDTIQDEREYIGDCYGCGESVDKGYRFCTVCGDDLLKPCVGCDNSIYKEFEHCPLCGVKQIETVEDAIEDTIEVRKTNIFTKKRKINFDFKLPSFKRPNIKMPSVQLPSLPKLRTIDLSKRLKSVPLIPSTEEVIENKDPVVFTKKKKKKKRKKSKKRSRNRHKR